jgi:toxin ParE1/3/4
MRLRWTEKASADVLSIHAYIDERSETYADAVYERIVGRPQQLINHPFSGSVVPEYSREDVREVFVHSFRLVYLVVGDEVRILTVIHGARTLPLDLPGTA